MNFEVQKYELNFLFKYFSLKASSLLPIIKKNVGNIDVEPPYKILQTVILIVEFIFCG